jgi:membrane protein
LALGAIVSLVLEVIYLTAWLSLPGGGAIVFPLSILVAFLFNRVLSKTALLWTKNKIVAAIPIMVWLAGFLAFAVNDGVKGDILVGADVRGLLLLVAGLAGGSWPLTLKK